MKKSDIRKWHRNLGILLALFIVFQAGSGLLITLNDLSVPHSHAHGDGPVHVKNHEAEKTIRHESYPDEDSSDHAQGHSAKRPT